MTEPMTPIEQAMIMAVDEKAFTKCLVCGHREAHSSMTKAKAAERKHRRETKHDASIVMGRPRKG